MVIEIDILKKNLFPKRLPYKRKEHPKHEIRKYFIERISQQCSDFPEHEKIKLVCTLCNREYKKDASLSSLKNHFKIKHQEEFSKVPEFYSPFKWIINRCLNSNIEGDGIVYNRSEKRWIVTYDDGKKAYFKTKKEAFFSKFKWLEKYNK